MGKKKNTKRVKLTWLEEKFTYEGEAEYLRPRSRGDIAQLAVVDGDGVLLMLQFEHGVWWDLDGDKPIAVTWL